MDLAQTMFEFLHLPNLAEQVDLINACHILADGVNVDRWEYQSIVAP